MKSLELHSHDYHMELARELSSSLSISASYSSSSRISTFFRSTLDDFQLFPCCGSLIVDMMIRISGVTRDRLPAVSGFKIQKGDDVTLKVSSFHDIRSDAGGMK